MKKNLTTALFIFFLTAGHSIAQFAHFTQSGTIEYTKTCNMYAILNRITEQETIPGNKLYLQRAVERYKKNQAQFKTLKSSLSFNTESYLYTPTDLMEPLPDGLLAPMADQNSITYVNLSTKTIVSQKKVFEETFLVKDTIRKIKWKITDETREIAGYFCQRANGIMLDSVYVVAFFTDQIPVSGGPESFSGLPGMILGVALPHENVSWFATKVIDMPISSTAFAPPKKGKITNYKELQKTLEPVLKNSGVYAQIFYKALSF